MNEAYGKLVHVLEDGGILHRFPCLADALWLACRLPADRGARAAEPAPEPPEKGGSVGPARKPPAPLPVRPQPEPPARVAAEPPPLGIKPLRIVIEGAEPEGLQVVVPLPGPSPAGRDERAPPGHEIDIPSPPSLAEPDRFLRQLKLLRRLYPSPRRRELNLPATIERFCEEQIPEPIFSPGYERSLNLTFLVDASPTMDLWRSMACELFDVLEASAAFQHCRAWLWSLRLEGARARATYSPLEETTPAGAPCRPGAANVSELLFSARDVVFLFSDCTAQRWYRADCLEELSQWARRAHLVVVNPLPQRFWTRTALEAAERINLIISQVASPNVAFRVSYPARPTADHALDRTLPLPVLAPDPRHLYAWTRFVALRRRTFPGRLFAGTRSHSTRRAGDQRRLDFRERLAMFKRQASPEAVELARLVAASPVINLPIVRFLRGHLLPRIRSGADPHDCSWDAEVMLSPLLRVAPRVHAVRPDDVLYCFHDEDLRASLLGELPRSRIEEVLEAIGFYVEHESLPLEAGRFHGFVAMLRNPEQAIGDEFYHVHEVVQVAARTIFRRLGGKYADLLKPQGQPRFLTELNTALRKAETARDGGDLAAALRVIDEAREAAAGENWRDARALLDETLRFYRGLLQVPELVRSAQAGRQPFVEPTTRMVLTPIAAGAFLMGSPDTEPERFPDEGPRHRVTLSHDFWMGIHPVTQEQYRAIMGTNPSQSKGKKRPVENVSWHDAVAFCDKLTEAARAAGVVPEGYVFRLPTEAEWEYCCRAGTETSTAFGDSLSSKQANFDGNVPYGNAEQGPYLQRTTDVGSYPPNAWGLFDMHGNVWEWCLDAAEGALVKTDTYVDGVVDPLCRVGRFRVYRGGSWIDVGRDCRSAFRIAVVPGGRYVRLGFRVCLARSPGGKRAVTETGEPVPSRAQPAGTASRSKSRRARTQPPP